MLNSSIAWFIKCQHQVGQHHYISVTNRLGKDTLPGKPFLQGVGGSGVPRRCPGKPGKNYTLFPPHPPTPPCTPNSDTEAAKSNKHRKMSGQGKGEREWERKKLLTGILQATAMRQRQQQNTFHRNDWCSCLISEREDSTGAQSWQLCVPVGWCSAPQPIAQLVCHQFCSSMRPRRNTHMCCLLCDA